MVESAQDIKKTTDGNDWRQSCSWPYSPTDFRLFNWPRTSDSALWYWMSLRSRKKVNVKKIQQWNREANKSKVEKLKQWEKPQCPGPVCTDHSFCNEWANRLDFAAQSWEVVSPSRRAHLNLSTTTKLLVWDLPVRQPWAPSSQRGSGLETQKPQTILLFRNHKKTITTTKIIEYSMSHRPGFIPSSEMNWLEERRLASQPWCTSMPQRWRNWGS